MKRFKDQRIIALMDAENFEIGAHEFIWTKSSYGKLIERTEV
jgi:hypothetical protein